MFVRVHVLPVSEIGLTFSFSILQPYDINLQVTSVIALLSQFNHPQLQEYLLNATLPLAQDCCTLHSTLQNVSTRIRLLYGVMLMIQSANTAVNSSVNWSQVEVSNFLVHLLLLSKSWPS